MTESPANAAPVSTGYVFAQRTIDSNGSFNVYQGEEVVIYAIAQINSSSPCLGVALQAGDVMTMTEANFGFVGNFNFNSTNGSESGSSYTLPDPIPGNLTIYAPQIRRNVTSTGTMTVSPKVKVTRAGNVLTETSNCVDTYASAHVDVSAGSYDLSSYVARVGDNRLSFYANACVDMTLVAPADVLTYSYTLTTGGQNVDPLGATPNYYWDQPMDGAYPGDTIKDPEPSRLQLNIANAVAPNPTAGSTYSFSLDIKKGNNSVAITCPPVNPGGGGGGGGGGGMTPSCTTGSPTSDASGITFDNTFGTSGVWTPVESGKSIMFSASLLGNDGKGYVLAVVETPMAFGSEVSRLYRLNTDGSIDSAWGTSGYVEVVGRFYALLLGSDGSFTLGGATYSGSDTIPTLVRLTSSGTLDSSWGAGGRRFFPTPPAGTFQNITEIAAGPSGSIYAIVETGDCSQGPCVYTNSVFKVSSAGSFDNNFGTNGALTVSGRFIRSDSTGALYVWNSDWTTSTSTMSKYDANGSPVGSFGSSGTLAPGAEIRDAKIIGTHMYALMSERLSSGGMGGPPSKKTTVARYDRATGVLDASFATAGVSTVFASGQANAFGLTPLPDGSFVLLGDNFGMTGPTGFLLLMNSAGEISANLPSAGATFTAGTCLADNLRGGVFTMGGSFFAFGSKYQMGANAPMGFKFTVSGVTAPSTPSTPTPSTPTPSTPTPSTPTPSTPTPSTPTPSTPTPSTPT
ncbi:MAG: hypothetical protein ACKOD2_03685, partial [Ilumatobacteraceae bacterium]